MSANPGAKKAREIEPDESSGLVMPLSIPLIAGPGAIVTEVTISSGRGTGWLIGLIGAAGVGLVAIISFQWLGGLLASVPQRTTALLLRLGGMLLATIGVQMLPGGLKNYFAAWLSAREIRAQNEVDACEAICRRKFTEQQQFVRLRRGDF